MKMRFVDSFDPTQAFPWERRTNGAHVVYRYPTEQGRATHLDSERAVLARPVQR